MVIDAHVHVWGDELLDAPWLADPAVAGLRRAFDLDDLSQAIAGAPVEGVVVVAADESAHGTTRLLERVEGHPLVKAVVGAMPWASDFAARLDDAAAASPSGLLRGVRIVVEHCAADWVVSPQAAVAFDELESRGLVLELLVGPDRLIEAAAVARTRPSLTVVVDHLGRPPVDGRLDAWRDALAEVAHSGAYAKLSGLAPERRAADFAPVVGIALELFGDERIMAGSDWPVSTLGATYGEVWHRMTELVEPESPVLGSTAARVYGSAA